MDLKKYKWLYLWIAAFGLIVFGALMLILKDFGESVVFYLSGAALITFVIIKFVPLIKTTKNKWAICMNAIEMFIDFVAGVAFIIITAKSDDADGIRKAFPFILGGVLYLRGIVYLTEISFFKTKPEFVKYIIHIALFTVGTVIMARYDSFTVNAFRWLFGLAFCISGAIATVDGGHNYGEYRKQYVKKTKKVKKSETIVDEENDVDTISDPIEIPKNDDGPYISA